MYVTSPCNRLTHYMALEDQQAHFESNSDAMAHVLALNHWKMCLGFSVSAPQVYKKSKLRIPPEETVYGYLDSCIL